VTRHPEITPKIGFFRIADNAPAMSIEASREQPELCERRHQSDCPGHGKDRNIVLLAKLHGGFCDCVRRLIADCLCPVKAVELPSRSTSEKRRM